MPKAVHAGIEVIDALSSLISQQSTPAHYLLAVNAMCLRFGQVFDKTTTDTGKQQLCAAFADVIKKNVAEIAIKADAPFVYALTSGVHAMYEKLNAADGTGTAATGLRAHFGDMSRVLVKRDDEAPKRFAIHAAATRLMLDSIAR